MKKNSCSWFLSESTARINIQQSTHYDTGALLANTSSRTIRKAIWLYYLLSMLYNIGAFNLQETPALNINTLLFHWQLNVISLTNTIDINIPEFFLIEFEFPVAWSSLDTPFTLASSGKLVSVLCWYRSEPKKITIWNFTLCGATSTPGVIVEILWSMGDKRHVSLWSTYSFPPPQCQHVVNESSAWVITLPSM